MCRAAYDDFGEDARLPERLEEEGHGPSDEEHGGDLNDEEGKRKVDGVVALEDTVGDGLANGVARRGRGRGIGIGSHGSVDNASCGLQYNASCGLQYNASCGLLYNATCGLLYNGSHGLVYDGSYGLLWIANGSNGLLWIAHGTDGLLWIANGSYGLLYNGCYG
jgi:hypothetical protein